MRFLRRAWKITLAAILGFGLSAFISHNRTVYAQARQGGGTIFIDTLTPPTSGPGSFSMRGKTFKGLSCTSDKCFVASQ